MPDRRSPSEQPRSTRQRRWQASGIVIDTISATGVNIDFGTTQIGAGTVTTAGVVIGNVTGAATGFAADFAS
ncbi:MAG: hypothetical protein HPM95_10770 [Alphaproteobacteria bacterium]|nr:hypothetical protein [Alphaproteobacteria bacterium]